MFDHIISVFVGILIVVIADVVIRRIRQRKKLVAHLHSFSISVPEEFKREFEQLEDSIDGGLAKIRDLVIRLPKEEAAENSNEKECSREEVLEILSGLQKLVRSLRLGVDGDEFSMLRAMMGRDISTFPSAVFRGSVTNRKGEVAKNVKMRIPDATFAEIEKPGIKKKSERVCGVLDIGNLQAKERVGFTIWCGGLNDKIKNENPVVTSDEGQGEICRYSLVPEFISELHRTWDSFKVLFGILFIVFVVVFYAIFNHNPNDSSESSNMEDMSMQGWDENGIDSILMP